MFDPGSLIADRGARRMYEVLERLPDSSLLARNEVTGYVLPITAREAERMELVREPCLPDDLTVADFTT